MHFCRCREIMDHTVPVLKNCNNGAISAALIDRGTHTSTMSHLIKVYLIIFFLISDRLVLGTDDGLFCVDLDRDEICRIGDGKKLHQVEYVADEQLIIALAGKQRQMRLIPVKALDQPLETEWIKLADTKGCVTFATGVMRPQQQQQKANNALRYNF